MRAAERQQEIEVAVEADRALLAICHVHQEAFTEAQPWRAPEPEPVDEKEISSRMTKDALAGISVMKRSERRAAKEGVTPRITAAIKEERKHRADKQAAEQMRLDDVWRKLEANEPETVIGVLEAAFEDNKAPAACVNCQGARVDLVMIWPEVDSVVPERKFTFTPSGKPTHRKRNKTEKNELYLEALASNAMATVKEALAVAPTIQEVGLLVLRKIVNGQRKTVEPLFAGLFDRSHIEAINWPEFGVAEDLISGSRANLNLKGRTKELAPIDLSDDPETRQVVEQVAKSLGAEAPSAKATGPRKSSKRRTAQKEDRDVATHALPERVTDTTFTAWQEQRDKLETELAKPRDPAKRYEVLVLLTNVMKLQYDGLMQELNSAQADMASISDRSDPHLSGITEFIDWIDPWIRQFQSEFDYFKEERDQLAETLPQVDRERVEAGIDEPFEAIKDHVRSALLAKRHALIASHGGAVAQAEDTKVCPDCAETIRAAARKCRFCGYQFE